jgi:hypothetical protein
MPNDLLNLDLRFLLARYGRQRVLEGLARVENVRPEDLDAELAKIEARPNRVKRRVAPTADETAANLHLDDPRRSEAVRELARRFDSGSFLSTLRDVDGFLRQNKVDHAKLRSRRDAGSFVVRFLASLDLPKLDDLIHDLDRAPGKSEYYRLAHQIMGRPSKSG